MNFSTIHSTHTTPKYNSYHRCIHHIATTSAPARPHEVYQLWPRDKALRPSLFRIEGSARRWKERLLQVPSTSLRPPNFQGEAAGVFRSVSQPPLACGGVGACRRRDHPGPPRLVLSGPAIWARLQRGSICGFAVKHEGPLRGITYQELEGARHKGLKRIA